MKPVYVCCLCAFALAACGVDGEPQQPAPDGGTSSVPVTGSATVGMSVGSSDTRGYGAVGLSNGPVSLIVGF